MTKPISRVSSILAVAAMLGGGAPLGVPVRGGTGKPRETPRNGAIGPQRKAKADAKRARKAQLRTTHFQGVRDGGDTT